MNTHWSPVTEPDLLTMLQDAESRMEGASAALWQLIRLPKPELWQQHPWADEVCGFWVVAVMGKVCIYYNDRSRGFSSGHFVRWGRIEDYQAGQLSLAERLQRFFSANGSPAGYNPLYHIFQPGNNGQKARLYSGCLPDCT